MNNSGCFSKGHTPWNKGLTKETDERVKNRCKPLTEEHKKKISERRKGFKFTEESLRKMSESHKGKKYGKRSQDTCEKIRNARLGHTVSEETREKISNSKTGVKMSEEAKNNKLKKEYKTKKKNNSFNTSKPEAEFLEILKKENPGKTILTNYKDAERYPFYCDFYIVEDDLFIELNAHWTHGGKPFNPDDQECVEKLKLWEEKSKQSKFYATAIETWTVRDVKKLECATNNKLNYKTIY